MVTPTYPMQDLTAKILLKFSGVFDRSPFMWRIVGKMIGALRSSRSELRNELQYVQNADKINEISCLKVGYAPTPTRAQGVQKMGFLGQDRWPPRVTLGRLLPHARGFEFKPRRGGFPSGAKKEWGLSPKTKVRVLYTAQLDVTELKNKMATFTCLTKEAEEEMMLVIHKLKRKHGLLLRPYARHFSFQLETFGARIETIRLLLAISANNKWEVRHFDVKSAFLHGDLKEVYVTQPEGFIKKEEKGKKCALEQAIYTRSTKDSLLLIGVYVDDLIITGTPKREIDKFKAQMEEKFEMSDLGLLAYHLGMEVTQDKGEISIKQSAYANKILKETGMLDSNETLIPMDPGTRLTKTTKGALVNPTEYRSIIGCLRYLLHTRPDLSYSVGLLSRFMQEPREQHMKAIKQVLRYVKGTKDYIITYKHDGGNKIHEFSNNSYGVNTQEGKGTTGIIFYYGESPIS
nr:ribonuclease H-like domain, reverse transcriptase, RNA-dependent DNA polymerase [Tanacetum cinerariifolium]